MSLGLAVLFIGVLYFALVNKTFRQIALSGLGVAVVVTLVFALWVYERDAEADQKRERAKTFIKTAEVEVIDPQVTFDRLDGHPMRIAGRVRNGSEYKLEKFTLRFTFQDCPQSTLGGSSQKSGTAQCETVGEQENEIRVEVPPSQSRDFDEYMSGPILSPKGTIRWNYQVSATSTQEY
jgi:hypothetical protein